MFTSSVGNNFLKLQKLLRASKSFMKVDEMREAFFEFDIDGDGTITTKVSTLQNYFFTNKCLLVNINCLAIINNNRSLGR